jgi:hypothetical protein
MMGMNCRSNLKPNIAWCMMRSKPPLELSPAFKAHVRSMIEDGNLDDVLTMDDGCVLYRTEHGWLTRKDYDRAARGSRSFRYLPTGEEAWRRAREDL